MTRPARAGLFIYAKDLQRVVRFYEEVVGMRRLRRSVAVLALLGSSVALAEPYSGSPTQEPIVRVLAWAILLGLCLGFSFLVAMVASRGRWRTRRFAGVLAGSFLLLTGAALLAGVLAGITEIVSLILHILLM